jgi:hypothetical protein
MIIWNINFLYAPLSRGKVMITARYTSSDFNGDSGIPPATNLVYTVLMRENYMKKYEQLEVKLYNRIDLFNGLNLVTTATLGRKNQLDNHSQFSLFYRNSKEFTPNIPGSLETDDPVLTESRVFTANVQLTYTPRQYYVIRNYRKELKDSQWPTFRVAYRQAFPLQAEGWSRFTMLEAGISQTVDVGLLSELSWSVDGGYFPDQRSIHFSDFKHFKSTPLLIDMAGFEDALMLMDYYEASTSEYWIAGKARLTSSYLLLKFLPWFSERLWKESLELSYLYTPATPHYTQLGYNLSEIFFLADLGIYVAFQEGKYKGFGARVNFRF